MQKYHRTDINIMSGWDKTCRVDIVRRRPMPELWRTKTYNPGAKSAARLSNTINDLMAQPYNRPSIKITLLGDTVFIDFEE